MKVILLTKDLISSISREMLYKQLINQINVFFKIDEKELKLLINIQEIVLQKLKICIEGINNKYYIKNNIPYFNPFHSGQYLTFLYINSNTLYKEGKNVLSEKIYYLN